jgi:hypothetical protein
MRKKSSSGRRFCILGFTVLALLLPCPGPGTEYASADDSREAAGAGDRQNCCVQHGLPGDANSDGEVNIIDILFIIQFLYIDGPNNDDCPLLLDADGSGQTETDPIVNLYDVFHLIQYLYCGGSDPCCPPYQVWCYGEKDEGGEE